MNYTKNWVKSCYNYYFAEFLTKSQFADYLKIYNGIKSTSSFVTTIGFN